MDSGARQNALKTNGWEPKNILSKMDPGARQIALKTKGMGAQKIFPPGGGPGGPKAGFYNNVHFEIFYKNLINGNEIHFII